VFGGRAAIPPDGVPGPNVSEPIQMAPKHPCWYSPSQKFTRVVSNGPPNPLAPRQDIGETTLLGNSSSSDSPPLTIAALALQRDPCLLGRFMNRGFRRIITESRVSRNGFLFFLYTKRKFTRNLDSNAASISITASSEAFFPILCSFFRCSLHLRRMLADCRRGRP
jgi:hypothetical protein